MYRTIEIGGKDYRQEFTVEASLNHDCIEKLINFITGAAMASSIDVEGLSDEEAVKVIEEAAKEGIKSMSDVPSVALQLWYAGFLEYHGPEGDGTVKTLKDAKNLYRQYREEHKEDGSFYDIITMCIEQMEADGFFELTGISKMLTPDTKTKKTPQDHKKKASKVTAMP